MMKTDAGTCASLSVSLLTTSFRLSNHFLIYTPIDLRFQLYQLYHLATDVWATRRLGDRHLADMVHGWATRRLGDRHVGDILGDKTFEQHMQFRKTFQLLILSRVLHRDKWAMKNVTD